MNIIEAIIERRSVRNYVEQALTNEQVSRLERAVNETCSPFNGRMTIRLKNFAKAEDFKPSTYGVIRGASDYFLIGMDDDEESALDVGFRFEQVVLKAWQMGLGTCWIAGTFKGTDFERGQSWPEGQRLRVVSPVGLTAQKTLMEKMMRTLVGSQKRKPFNELFFTNQFREPLANDNKFAESLRMLRLAPSSTNSQPWRCLVTDDKVLFYYKPKSKISVLDCGIGMCHFYETERFNGHEGRFFKETDVPSAPEKWIYLRSYIRTS